MSDAREAILRPRAGWLSLGLLAVMLLALAWSVQGAAWLERMDFLAPVALFAVLTGGLLAVLPLSVALTLPLSAVVGGLLVLWAVGGEYHPQLGQIGSLLALREELTGWLVTLLDSGYPLQQSPYALGLGLLMWTTGFMAAQAVYRYHRVIDAILLVGLSLVANMSATYADLFGHLLLFVTAALLLWLRASLVARQEGWQRRRVNENLEVPASIMRSGIIFAGGSVALAWVLTSVAVAAPLTGAWRSLDTVWSDLRDQFDGVFGQLTNAQARISGNSFGASFTVSGKWVSNDDEVMLVAAPRPAYMRTGTYDLYTGRGWERSDGTKRQIAPGDLVFPSGSPERPEVGEAFVVETLTVEMRKALGRNLFTPGYPLRIFASAVIHEPGSQPFAGGLESANPIGSAGYYQVQAALSNATEADLAAAGTDYPASVTALYLDTSLLTDRVRDEAGRVAAEAGAANPYAQAKALARFLSRDPSFSYATEAPVPSAGEDLVDFFLFDQEGRVGYCQYYASAMVVMARALGIPARVAVGFAPGERVEEGVYLVREANAHAWAEVYFPGYGWQIFEATKTINPGFVRSQGDPGQLPTPVTGRDDPLEAFEANFDPSTIRGLPDRSSEPIEGAVDPTRGSATDQVEEARRGNAIVIVVLLLGLGTFLWVRMRRMQRRWRFLPAGDRAWERLAQAVDRAGVAPRPSETIYEYAGWLEGQIPRRRPEIRTIADGKVWQTYSGRPVGLAAVARLEAAWRRLRLPLVGLVVRRWLRSLVRR